MATDGPSIKAINSLVITRWDLRKRSLLRPLMATLRLSNKSRLRAHCGVS